ncbi:MAG: IS481 family transposase, partial [Hydrogenophilales bacterium CG15_BIG_FIL_POST_REV_8_21_14_020_62_31]
HQTPIQALKKWQTEKPELFVKRVYKQAGLDRKGPCFVRATEEPRIRGLPKC